MRALLWLFFLADLAGVAWAVRVLVREAHRHLSWHLAQRRARREASVAAPLGSAPPRSSPPRIVLPEQRPGEMAAPARAASILPGLPGD